MLKKKVRFNLNTTNTPDWHILDNEELPGEIQNLSDEPLHTAA